MRDRKAWDYRDNTIKAHFRRDEVESLFEEVSWMSDNNASTRHCILGYVRKSLTKIVASRPNPVLRELYQRLVEPGKPKKVALTGCMRKLLTVLNMLLRMGNRWYPIISTT